MAGVSTIPAEVLSRVMSFVPTKQRLSSCGLVSRRWAEATATATDSISVGQLHRVWTTLQDYLHKHGQYITFLELWEAHTAAWERAWVRTLPCRNLVQLQLTKVHVQLLPGGGHQGALHSCTALQTLCLSWVRLDVDSSTLLQLLSGCPCLEILRLCYVDFKRPADSAAATETTLVCSNVFVFSRLKEISVKQAEPSAMLQALSAMPYLQHLDISTSSDVPFALPGLQQLTQLTRLQIFTDSLAISTESTPGFSQLTTLRFLELCQSALDASLLRTLTQLQHLILYDVRLQDAATLLAALAQLQQLTMLYLSDLTCQWPAASLAYGAFTASSKLQELMLYKCKPPGGIWPYVFAPGKQLQELRLVELWWPDNPDEQASPPPTAGELFSSGDIQLLVDACPALGDLTLAIQPSAEVIPLSQLTKLTALYLRGTSAAGFAALRKLAGLQELQLHSTPDCVIKMQWLQPLTALRQLAWLRCMPYSYEQSDGEESEDSDVDKGLSLSIDSEEGEEQLWLQLLARCAKSHPCQPGIIRDLGQQLAQAQDQLQTQQQHILQLEQQVAQQQVGQTAVQRQLADQGAAMAEMRMQLQQLTQGSSSTSC